MADVEDMLNEMRKTNKYLQVLVSSVMMLRRDLEKVVSLMEEQKREKGLK